MIEGGAEVMDGIAADLVVWMVSLDREYQAVEGQFEDPAGTVDDAGLLYA